MPLNIANPDLKQQYFDCLFNDDSLPAQPAVLITIKDEKIKVEVDPATGECKFEKDGNTTPGVLQYEIDIFSGKTKDELKKVGGLQDESASLIKGLPVQIQSGLSGCSTKKEFGANGGSVCQQYISAALNQTCSALVPAVPDPTDPPDNIECKCRDFFGNERTNVDCAPCNPADADCPRPINEPDLEKVAQGLMGPQFLSYVNNLMDNANAEHCGSATREVRFWPKLVVIRGVATVSKTCIVDNKPVTTDVPVQTEPKVLKVLKDFGDDVKCILTLDKIKYRYWPSTTTNCVLRDPDNLEKCIVRRAKGADEQNSSAQLEMNCPDFFFDRCWGWEFFTYRTFGTPDNQDLRWDTRGTISQQDLFGNAMDVTLNDLYCLSDINAIAERLSYKCINSPCAGTAEVDFFVAQNAKTIFTKYAELLRKAHDALVEKVGEFITEFEDLLETTAENIPEPAANCICATSYSGVEVTTNYQDP